jgi:hypothetical protein
VLRRIELLRKERGLANEQDNCEGIAAAISAEERNAAARIHQRKCRWHPSFCTGKAPVERIAGIDDRPADQDALSSSPRYAGLE